MPKEHEGSFKRYKIFFPIKQFYNAKFPKLGNAFFSK
jgi:hypothetical protein